MAEKRLVRTNLNKCVSDWVTELDRLMRSLEKNTDDHDRIRELSFLLEFDKTRSSSNGLLCRRNGNMFLKPCNSSRETKASKLTNWNGWIALQTVPIIHQAIANTARVIAEVDPDILILQEVEDKASLMEFNRTILPQFGMTPFNQVLVLDGNDEFGRGMGIMLKNGYQPDSIKSHALNSNIDGKILFDTDCPEYLISTPEGKSAHILSNQFSENNGTKRKIQALKVAAIHDNILAKGHERVIVCGSLNDSSYSDNLSPTAQGNRFARCIKKQGFQS